MTFLIDEDVACFTCDTCPEHIECTGCGRDFTTAKIFAQRAGWKTYKGPDQQWAHSCPVCVANWAKDQREKERR